MIFSILQTISALHTVEEAAVNQYLQQKHHLAVLTAKEGSTSYNILSKIEQVFEGYLTIVHVEGQTEGLKYLGPQVPVTLVGKIDLDSVSDFLLNGINELTLERSKVARANKAHRDFLDKEVQRAKKETEQQKKLSERSDLKRLDPAGFNDLLSKSKGGVLIQFLVANCSECREWSKQLQKTATQGVGKFVTGKVNCTSHQQFCSQFKIQTFPRVVFYKPGNKNINTFETYQTRKSNTAFFFSEWADTMNKQAAQAVDISAVDQSSFDSVCKGSKIVCFFLFSNDEKLKGKLVQIKKQYNDKPITLFYASLAANSALAKQFQITSQPAILFVHGQRKRFQAVVRDDISEEYLSEKIAAIMAGERNNFKNYKEEVVVG